MKKTLTFFIAVGLILGLVVGFAGHAWLSPEAQTEFAAGLNHVTSLFMRLIKMIIAPLVLATLVGGIAHMESAGVLGRTGLRTMLWFLGASLVSITLGLLFVNILQPGVGANLVAPASASTLPSQGLSLASFLTQVVPVSAIAAMAENAILQIVFFSVLVGLALLSIGPAAQPLVKIVDLVADVMLRITGYVMKVSPIAVFAAVASVLTVQGPSILLVYGRFLGSFYLGVAALWLLLLSAGAAVVGWRRILALPKTLRAPLLLAFSTASSEAALAPTLAALERFGVKPQTAGFVLPLGYSFNLDGTMMYAAFGAVFLAQAYGIEMDLWQQIVLLLTLMVTSKGVAGVPRAAIVVLAGTLPHFGIPEAGLLALLAIDHFVDMGRTATNVIGNSIAAVVVDHAERKAEVAEISDEPAIPSDVRLAEAIRPYAEAS
jgi:Na+/H+-dicarboxylate symporter